MDNKNEFLPICKNAFQIQRKVIEIANNIDTTRLDNTLFRGRMGCAMFFYYYSRFMNDINFKKKADELTNCCIETISSNLNDFSLSCGLSGTAWALQSLTSEGFINITSSNAFEEVDYLLNGSIEEYFKEDSHDLISGVLGIGIYFLERFPHSHSDESLKKIILFLKRSAIVDQQGMRWESKWFKNGNGEKKSSTYDLGLAHGIPGMIFFLSKAFYFGIEKKVCFEMLSAIIDWLLLKRLPDSEISLFPSIAHDELSSKSNSSRLAWCYGDLSIATALWEAGSSTKNAFWKNYSINLLLKSCLRKEVAETQILDTCLCHGSSGVAHIYNRFYQRTKISEFENSALFWYQKTLEFSCHEGGIAGYKFWLNLVGDLKGKWLNEINFIEGVTGTGIALLASIDKSEPKWDKCLMLS